MSEFTEVYDDPLNQVNILPQRNKNDVMMH